MAVGTTQLTPCKGDANVRPMPIPSALVCVRCGARYPIDRFAHDCPVCRTAGAPANLTVAYDSAAGDGRARDEATRRPASIWRWEASLPPPAPQPLSLAPA